MAKCDPRSGARSCGRVRHLLAGCGGKRAQCFVGNACGSVVWHEVVSGRVVEIAHNAAVLDDLRDQVAFHNSSAQGFRSERRRGAAHQQTDTRGCAGAVVVRQRDLLTDYGREVAIERKNKLLNIASSRIRIIRWETHTPGRPEYLRAQEAEDRIGRTISKVAKPANLIAGWATVRCIVESHRWCPEHPNLCISVAQMRNLDDFGQSLEALVTSCTKESFRSVQDVAPVTTEGYLSRNHFQARHDHAVGGSGTSKEITSTLLRGR